jgi:riboflavin synthase
MFTGIVTDVGRIARVEPRGDLRVVVETAYDTSGLSMGASVACSGACLTVVDKGPGWFAVDVSAETVSKTARGMWTAGRALNLERALKVGDELGGHIVTGHVDAVATVVAMTPEGDSTRIEIEAPVSVAAYIAPKGSICLDGTSLTVNEVSDDAQGVRFGVNVIPHTAAVTTWGELRVGSELNLEIDVLARYLGRMQKLLPV